MPVFDADQTEVFTGQVTYGTYAVPKKTELSDISFTVPGSRFSATQRVGYVAWTLALRAVSVAYGAHVGDPPPDEPEAILALEAGCSVAIREGNAGRAMRLAEGWRRAWLDHIATHRRATP